MEQTRRGHANHKPWMRKNLPRLVALLVGTAVLAGGLYLASRQSPQDHLQKGLALQEAGDLKGAAIELKNALQAMPNNAEARHHLGQIHFANGDYVSAEKEIQKARELGLRDADLAPLFARTLLLIGAPQRVLDEVRPSEDADATTRAAVLALRARAQLMLKDASACRQSLGEADASSPEHPETLVTRALLAVTENDTSAALGLLEKALAKAPKRADYWLLKGDLLRAAKQNSQALQAYAQTLASEPSNVPARLARTQLFLEESSLDKASAELKALRKHAPSNLMASYLEAFMEFKRSHFAEANTILQGVLRASPDFLPGQLLAGTVNIALGNREAAHAHLEKVLSRAPQHALARKLMAATLADLGNLNEAKQVIDGFGKRPDDPMLNALQGQIALRQGDYSEARKHLEQVPEDAAHGTKYFTDLAASRLGTGDEAGALTALNKAAELDTDSARPDVLLVMVHLREKRYAEAMQVVDKLARERPKDPLVHNLRGGIYLSQDDLRNARAHFEQALQADPAYFPAASNLARLDMRGRDVKAARARFQRLLENNPKEGRAWLALAEIDAQSGDEASYLGNIERAIKADEKQPQPHLALIRHRLAKKDAGKALVAARSALNATGRAEFQEFIGLALATQGDHVGAQATFSKWAQTNPKNPVPHFRLSQAQLAAEDRTGALKSLDKALALRPDFAEAALAKAILLGQMGRTEEGIRIARTWQANDPKVAAGFLTEAELLFGAKKYLEAGKLYAKGARIANLGTPMGKAYQAYALAGQAPEGETLLGEWLKDHPTDTVVRHQLALAQLNAKRLKEAAENYRVLARANTKDLVAYNNLAWLLGELRDKDAIAIAEQALKLDPANPATLDTLGWILINAGQVQRGVDILAKAHGKAPAAAEIHWHWAAGLAKAGNHARAKQELEKLIYSGLDFPQKPQAKQLLDTL